MPFFDGDGEQERSLSEMGECGNRRSYLPSSLQRVIGALANITQDYATKRYRSNVINWGMLPFHLKGEPKDFEVGDYIYVPEVRKALAGDMQDIKAYVVKKGAAVPLSLYIKPLNEEEKAIIKAGCLINFNRARKGL